MTAPNLPYEFTRAFAGAVVEYLIFCGSAFLLLYVVLRRVLSHRKITQTPTDYRDPLREIGRTLIGSLLGKAPLAVALLYLASINWIPHRLIYRSVDEHGWVYFAATIVFDLLVFDLWFYLSHRFFLHSRFGFRHFHIVHHRSTDPTPFARNAVHPVEGFLNGIFHVLPVFIMPHHPIAIVLSTQLKGLVGVMGHLGYETMWSGYTRHWLTRYFMTPVHHHMHHAKNFKHNFSFLINYDLLFGTLAPDYHEVFEATVNRPRSKVVDRAS